MTIDERQQFYETMVEEYRSIFAPMNDAERSSWFFAMDESVILSFDVGKDESILEAEERHEVKLLAIAEALSSLPCATKEKGVIEDLRRMAGARAQRQANGTSFHTGNESIESSISKALKVLKEEGLL